MDIFNHGQTLISLQDAFISGARRTGKTTLMLKALKPGDRVVVTTHPRKLQIERQLAELDVKDVDVIVFPVNRAVAVNRAVDYRKFGTPQGRVYFEHTWVEAYYARIIRNADTELQMLHRQMSGWSDTHEETRKQAQAFLTDGLSVSEHPFEDE